LTRWHIPIAIGCNLETIGTRSRVAWGLTVRKGKSNATINLGELHRATLFRVGSQWAAVFVTRDEVSEPVVIGTLIYAECAAEIEKNMLSTIG
jgi:hypothetical protein